MIASLLKGGLGNQLFQLAAGISHATDTSQEFIISKPLINSWHASQGESPNTYLSTIFTKLTINDAVPSNRYTEPRFQYDSIPHNLTDCVLSGYFQSHKYFEHNRGVILDSFCFDHVSHDDLALDQLCSLHVRRGDYTKLKHYHLNLDIDYYDQAMKMVDCDRFLIFSDDIDWCKSVFTGDRFVFSSEANADSIIYMRSKCSSNIIANSSLSWWGAWLSNDMHKKVIVPGKWFVDPDMNADDLIPADWIEI